MPPQTAVPARARRRAHGAAREKRAAILHAARQLFSRNGFDNTNMDAIAACADVSKATVYAHFANKDALFRATVDAMVGEMPDRWDALLASGGPLQLRLTAVAHDLMQMTAAPMLQAIHRMLALSTQLSLQRADTYWDLCFERYDRAMQRFLRAEIRQGSLAIADVAQASAQFFGLIASASVLRGLLTGAPFVPQRPGAECVESAVALFVRGYRAEANPAPAPRRRIAAGRA
ncbi:TetR/AcrR family transcriptional regulator [Xanthomonas bundabergensis]|uniref:TetR/AcrR family transcriptional regulator n=1 Tax=Xanthomonas bundabergensis TaxID=3160842 RepID=UPI00351884D1